MILWGGRSFTNYTRHLLKGTWNDNLLYQKSQMIQSYEICFFFSDKKKYFVHSDISDYAYLLYLLLLLLYNIIQYWSLNVTFFSRHQFMYHLSFIKPIIIVFLARDKKGNPNYAENINYQIFFLPNRAKYTNIGENFPLTIYMYYYYYCT